MDCYHRVKCEGECSFKEPDYTHILFFPSKEVMEEGRLLQMQISQWTEQLRSKEKMPKKGGKGKDGKGKGC